MTMLSTTDCARRLLTAQETRVRLVEALKEAGLGILARHVTAQVGMIDGARLEVLPRPLNEADALTAALRRPRIARQRVQHHGQRRAASMLCAGVIDDAETADRYAARCWWPS
ncbi:MAG: hypothetical protein ACRDJ9_03120 [Dehalococcoidia bacterium]